MTYLSNIMSVGLFEDMVREGYVRVQTHPNIRGYRIANYSERAVMDKVWNNATLQCRGLILDGADEVVARPFRKFFNAQESTAPTIHASTPVIVTDKMDGSLGILYPTPGGGWAISTRGSFASAQALHATVLYNARYAPFFRPIPGITYLFEIIYPKNRIVVDYGSMDDLVLLGAVDIATGRSIAPQVIQNDPKRRWPGPVAETFSYATYGQAIAAKPRQGQEGLVVHDLLTDERVKLKQEDYVILHRLVTGLTSRRVHEAMVAGIPLDEFIAPFPDEFHDWIRDVAGRIQDQYLLASDQVDKQWRAVVAQCEQESPEHEDLAENSSMQGSGWPAAVSMGLATGRDLSREQRSLFARIAKDYSYAWALFSKLDAKDYHSKLLKMAQPEEIETPQGRTFTEATA